MQALHSEPAIPIRLLCGGCRHWQKTAIRAMPDGGVLGRCGRFGENRAGTARPRCNICWEPPAPTVHPVAPPVDD